MSMLTGFIIYLVIGFVFSSLLTMFKYFIITKIFNDPNGAKYLVENSLFLTFIAVWPLPLGIVLIAAICALFKGSLTGYIIWLENILGAKK